MDDKIYRLPTEAEWEYAARAGSTTAFYNGERLHTNQFELDSNLDQIGWYRLNCSVYDTGVSWSTTHPVAQKQPNAWGLYDMSGNVMEWCQDWFGDYPEEAITDPTGPETGKARVLRGGSYYDYADSCRSAARQSEGIISGHYGFRLAVSPSR